MKIDERMKGTHADAVFVLVLDHPVTKMYVKGGRGGVCNIHFTVVHFFYWGILAYNFQRGGGGFLNDMGGAVSAYIILTPPQHTIKIFLCTRAPLSYINFCPCIFLGKIQ